MSLPPEEASTSIPLEPLASLPPLSAKYPTLYTYKHELRTPSPTLSQKCRDSFHFKPLGVSGKPSPCKYPSVTYPNSSMSPTPLRHNACGHYTLLLASSFPKQEALHHTSSNYRSLHTLLYQCSSEVTKTFSKCTIYKLHKSLVHIEPLGLYPQFLSFSND